jgi:hypothetical protein
MKNLVKVTRFNGYRCEEYGRRNDGVSYWEVYKESSGEKVAFFYMEEELNKFLCNGDDSGIFLTSLPTTEEKIIGAHN